MKRCLRRKKCYFPLKLFPRLIRSRTKMCWPLNAKRTPQTGLKIRILLYYSNGRNEKKKIRINANVCFVINTNAYRTKIIIPIVLFSWVLMGPVFFFSVVLFRSGPDKYFPIGFLGRNTNVCVCFPLIYQPVVTSPRHHYKIYIHTFPILMSQK